MSETQEELDKGWDWPDWPICQEVADMYNSGAKLFRKQDLEDIERQLRQACTMERFALRRLDGATILIPNPMFEGRNPTCKLVVDYRGYWELVKKRTDRETITSLCPYTVNWIPPIEDRRPDLLPQPMQLFDEKQSTWLETKTCRDLTALIKDILSSRSVTKVVCFGLGDFSHATPQWFKDEFEHWDESNNVKMVAGSLFQHSMALTIAEFARASGDRTLPLFAQDPGYSKTSEDILIEKGFKIVGSHGAGGFAELDDETIVITAFPDAPMKQIIADIARPAVIITTDWTVFNPDGEPFADAESPRTREMWLEYDFCDMPTHDDEDFKTCWGLRGLLVNYKRQSPSVSDLTSTESDIQRPGAQKGFGQGLIECEVFGR